MDKTQSSSNFDLMHQTLLQEFKSSIENRNVKATSNIINLQYKRILSQLNLSNENRKRQLKNKIEQAKFKSLQLSGKIDNNSSVRWNLSNENSLLIYSRQDNTKQDTQKLFTLVSKPQKAEQQLESSKKTVKYKVELSNLSKKHAIDSTFQELDQKVIMQQLHKDRLEQQISNLKKSFQNLKMDLAEVRHALNIQIGKQEKYKEVNYLSKSLQNQTQMLKIENFKEFRQMLQKQSDIQSNLKKYQQNLKKQIEKMEIQYYTSGEPTQFKNTKQPKQNQQHKTSLHKKLQLLRINSSPTFRKNFLKPNSKQYQNFMNGLMNYSSSITPNFQNPNSLTKNQIKFIEFLQKVLEILKINETDYQQLKASYCTRVRIKTVNYDILNTEYKKKFQTIYAFQERFDIRLESVAELIVQVFRQLKTKNDQRKKLIMQLTKIKEDYNEQLNILMKKQIQTITQEPNLWNVEETSKKTQQKMVEYVNSNSQTMIKIVGVFYTLLMKFKYMYKISLVLNLEKNNFNDLLTQINKLFGNGLYFHSFQPFETKNNEGFQTKSFSSKKIKYTTLLSNNKTKISEHLSNLNQNINYQQFSQLISKHFPAITGQYKDSICKIFFADIRVPILLKKNWILDEIKTMIRQKSILQADDKNLEMQEKQQIHQLESFFQLMQNLDKQCEDAFMSKFKSICSLFLNCYKSIRISKQEFRAIDHLDEQAKPSEFQSIFLRGMSNQIINKKNKSLQNDRRKYGSQFFQQSMFGDKQQDIIHNEKTKKQSTESNLSSLILKLKKCRNKTGKKSATQLQVVDYTVQDNFYAKRFQVKSAQFRKTNKKPTNQYEQEIL